MASIKRPGRKFKSANGNFYVKQLVDGEVKVCMLDQQANDDWDQIDTMEIAPVHYENSMLPTDQDGVPTGPSFDRLEVIDYQTFGRQIVVAEHEVKVKKLHTATVISSPAGALAHAD